VFLKHHIIPVILLLVFLAMAAAQIFIPPFIGLANNGDFGRVISRFAFAPAGGWHDEFIFFVADYRQDASLYWNAHIPSSEILLFAPVAWFSEHFTGGRLDIRWQGLVHLSLLATGFMLSLHAGGRSLRQQATLGLAMLWILDDVRYVAALNSFYTDTAACVGLFIAVPALVLSIRNDSAIASLLLFLGCGLLAASKTQHAPIGVLVSAVLLVAGFARRRWHSVVAGLALAAVSFVVFRLTPTDYNARPLFSAVFFKILPASPNQASDARELGLRPEELRYVGMHAYMRGSPCEDWRFQADFARRVTPLRLTWFYLRHPWRAARLAYKDLAVEGPQMRSINLTNYQRKDGFPAGTLSRRFCTWTDIRSWLLGVWPTHQILLYAAAIVWGLFSSVRTRRWGRTGVVLLAACGLYSFASAVFFDATETSRHLGLFHAITDSLVIVIAVIAFDTTTHGATLSTDPG
jgi:hypothetical protein